MSRKTPTNVNGGVYNAVAPVFTDGSFVCFQFDVNGNLLTTGGGGGGGNASVNPVGTPVPGSATMIGLEDSSGDTQFVSAANPLPITGSISASNPSVGATGTTAPNSATLLGVLVSGDLQPVSSTYPVRVDPTGTTTQPVSFLSLPAGSNLIGQVEVSDGTNVLFTSGHPGYVQGTLATTSATSSAATATWTQASQPTLTLNVTGYNMVAVAWILNSGTPSGGSEVAFYGSVDGTHYTLIQGIDTLSGATNNGWGYSYLGGNSHTFQVSVAGYVSFQIATSGSPGGTFNATLTAIASNAATTPVVGVVQAVAANLQATVSQGSLAWSVSPNSSSISATNALFDQITDGTNAMGAMANFGTSPTGVKALNANVSLFQGTTLVGTGAPLQVTLANTGSNANAVKVDPSAVTSPVSLASLPALPAGTNLIGQVSASAETSTVYNGTTALTPGFALIATSTSGASSLVSAVSGKKIRVLALVLTANAAVNVKFQSHVTPTDLTGLFYLAANGGFTLPFNPAGWFQTVAGEQLDINLSGSVAVGGCLTYVAL